MYLPNYKTIRLPFLEFISDSQVHHRKDIADALAERPFKLTPEQRAESRKDGLSKFDQRCDFARFYLKEAGLLMSPHWGYNKITSRGLSVISSLKQDRERIEKAFLKSDDKLNIFLNDRWPNEGE